MGTEFTENQAKKMHGEYLKKEKILNDLAKPIGYDILVFRGQETIQHDNQEGTLIDLKLFTSTSLGLGPSLGYGEGKYIYEIGIKKDVPLIQYLQQGKNKKEVELTIPTESQAKEIGNRSINNINIISAVLTKVNNKKV